MDFRFYIMAIFSACFLNLSILSPGLPILEIIQVAQNEPALQVTIFSSLHFEHMHKVLLVSPAQLLRTWCKCSLSSLLSSPMKSKSKYSSPCKLKWSTWIWTSVDLRQSLPSPPFSVGLNIVLKSNFTLEKGVYIMYNSIP